MLKYKTWAEYYASEQEYYIDEENCADYDVLTTHNYYEIHGQSNCGAYIITTIDDRGEYCDLVGIWVSDYISEEHQLEEIIAELERI
jgi:hypothetical protein